MKLEDFNYHLDTRLIAQQPSLQRDNAKLLIFNTGKKAIQHSHVHNVMQVLKAGDILVLNNSKVIPARLIGHKFNTQGKVEIFLLRKKTVNTWQCLIGGRGCRKGVIIKLPRNVSAEIIQDNHDGTWLVTFNKSGEDLMRFILSVGRMPLPPYIKRDMDRKDKHRYQTVYAGSDKIGSVAAPTAGLHFTKKLLNKLQSHGVQLEYVTLHVGLGTFAPVKTDNILKHHMHAERVEVSTKTLQRIMRAKKEGRRIIAVGTTSVRVLESAVARHIKNNDFTAVDEDVDIFIYPGFNFQVVDAMLTNFHLPKSTLLMLISAFLQDKGCKDGVQMMKKIYKLAQQKKYRFFSYGDAMLIE